MDALKNLQGSRDHIHAKLARHEKSEARSNQELEATQHRLTEAENECSSLRQTVGRLEREQKQREAASKSDSVRLHRQEEQLAKLKLEEKSVKTMCRVSMSYSNVVKSSKVQLTQ